MSNYTEIYQPMCFMLIHPLSWQNMWVTYEGHYSLAHDEPIGAYSNIMAYLIRYEWCSVRIDFFTHNEFQ